MKYNEAEQIKQLNPQLIGSYSEKGFLIDEIIIVPTREDSRNKFFKMYLAGQSPESAIKLFTNEDVQVWVIDKKYLHESNILFYSRISQ